MAAEVINNHELTSNNNQAPAERNNNQAPTGVNNNQAPASSGPTVYSGSNMTSEAAGLFLTAALMQELNVENGQISVQSTHLQSLENNYQQQTTIEKYNKQALSSWLEMGSSLTSAAITGGTYYFDNREGGDAGQRGKELGEQQGQLDNLNNIQKQAQDGLLKTKDFELTADGAPADLDKYVNETRPKESPIVNNRIKEMQTDQFDTTSFKEEHLNDLEKASYDSYLSTPDANGKLPVNNDTTFKKYLDEQSFEAMTNGENQAVKGKIDEQVANKYKEVETTSQKWQSARSNNKMVSEMFTQGARAGFDMGKAIATQQTGKKEALLTCEQFNQQIAQTVQQNEMEQIRNNRSTMDGEFAALVQGASRA